MAGSESGVAATVDQSSPESARHLGYWGATGVGVGAIVGGGILALAGAAFAATGPSALLAFTLNGCIAGLTALSFAEVASRFPESGGTYLFAKKVLSVESAFTVGWVVWFASLVAAVLYAIGFAEFAVAGWLAFCTLLDWDSPAWVSTNMTRCLLASLACAAYAAGLILRPRGGGQWVNVGKVLAFAILIGGGVWAVWQKPSVDLQAAFTPFFPAGMGGLFQAMGFSFIALQGFDLIAAVGGEVKQASRTIPRAMLTSLAIALAIYLPLLFVVAGAGIPEGGSIQAMATREPETLLALAARRFLGPVGYWLVIVAAILSMLSALRANLFAASRVALSMAQDRTLPSLIARQQPISLTPVPAVLLTAGLVILLVYLLPNVAAAGAASSLIFLLTFALAHWIAILVRQRTVDRPPPFRVPLFPAVPVLGGLACLGLAAFQGIMVPSAGLISLVWLTLGAALFLGLFAQRARLFDASSSAANAEALRLRGKSPLVLVPIVNPHHAQAMVEVADALSPPEVGRVMLLSVVVAKRPWGTTQEPQAFANAANVLTASLQASAEVDLYPDSLITIAQQPWTEIVRVSKQQGCESLLLGFSQVSREAAESPLDELLGQVDSDVVVLRSPDDWRLSQATRILVPVGGAGAHDLLLARLLSSLQRQRSCEVTFLQVLDSPSQASDLRRAERTLKRFAREMAQSNATIQVVSSGDVEGTILREAASNDLLVMGAQRLHRRHKLFGDLAMSIAERCQSPILLISRSG